MKTVHKDVSAWVGLLALPAFAAAPSHAQGVLKVMRQGLGDGTVQITEYNWYVAHGYDSRRIATSTPSRYLHFY